MEKGLLSTRCFHSPCVSKCFTGASSLLSLICDIDFPVPVLLLIEAFHRRTFQMGHQGRKKETKLGFLPLDPGSPSSPGLVAQLMDPLLACSLGVHSSCFRHLSSHCQELYLLCHIQQLAVVFKKMLQKKAKVSK